MTRLATKSAPESLGLNEGQEWDSELAKTRGLTRAQDHYKLDVALGGARHDEEKSRARVRIFPLHSSAHHWDPKTQHSERWNLCKRPKNARADID
ncbi:phosphoadenosine phosphosulfate reductase family protein [Pseudomonas protegens]|uniref:phosphoadenosine phosphosulfate reductase domain-containing protein n=1 Tax=Pseudomonas protegens TaxID=380021 RepID=UPI0009BBC70B